MTALPDHLKLAEERDRASGMSEGAVARRASARAEKVADGLRLRAGANAAAPPAGARRVKPRVEPAPQQRDLRAWLVPAPPPDDVEEDELEEDEPSVTVTLGSKDTDDSAPAAGDDTASSSSATVSLGSQDTDLD